MTTPSPAANNSPSFLTSLGLTSVTVRGVRDATFRGEMVFAIALMAILATLIFPLPKWLLDIALALSLTLSILVLMTALFIERPLDFSAFPTVLLVTTMLRLALNVASTRLILSDGHEGVAAAGAVIRAFGHFIMGGNFVIGLIVFAILVLVNFIVITKGSGRIAEVSARFSLDAMPGKQMAIDADLSAGIINEEQAKKRRRTLEDESNFFGSMDGAAKFVRGDAIAGICITFINIVGGIIIGVVQKGIPLSDAAHCYTTLTVGDGLVTQIPALIVSTAAGLLVTKAGSEGSADKAFFSQLSAFPSALGLSSFLMVVLSLLPEMPMLPFLILAIATGGAAFKMVDVQEKTRINGGGVGSGTSTGVGPIGAESPPQSEEEQAIAALHMDQIRIELGYGLLPLVNGEKGNILAEQVKILRTQLARELGFLLPTVRLQDNVQLPANTYVVKMKEVEVARGTLRPFMVMAIDPEGKPFDLLGEEAVEPTFGLDALWIHHNQRGDAEERGYTIVEPLTVISTHLSEIIRENASEIFSFSDTQNLLNELSEPHQKLLGDIIPGQMTTAGIQRILQNLLRERVSIRDLPTILEALAEMAPTTRQMGPLTEHVRSRLARQLCMANLDEDGVLPLILLGSDWEKNMVDSLSGDGDGRHLALAPSKLQEFRHKIQETFDEQGALGVIPVLLTSHILRPHVRSMLERFRPLTVVMSQNEIHPKMKIKTVARI